MTEPSTKARHRDGQSAAVTVVIVSWNDTEDALRCLRSVRAAAGGNVSILLVDNGSATEAAERLAREAAGLPLIRLAENLGYTGGYNIGIRHALAEGAEYMLLLNSDAELLPGALPALLNAASLAPNAAFVGAAVVSGEDDAVVVSAGGDLVASVHPLHRTRLEKGDELQGARAVDFVSGCALLVRASALDDIGLLDEGFFAYYEDIDWCLRARKAGYEVLVEPAARVRHPDPRWRDADSPAVTYYLGRNSLRFARKHAPGRLPALWLRHLRTALSWTLRPRWRRKRAQRDALLRGLWDALRGYRGAWHA